MWNVVGRDFRGWHWPHSLGETVGEPSSAEGPWFQAPASTPPTFQASSAEPLLRAELPRPCVLQVQPRSHGLRFV